jgi:thiol-disulfide isomerase/thioredoxin
MNLSLLLVLILCCFTQAVSALEENQPAPACAAKLQNQESSFTPETYAGKVVLVDFWATWCGPCLKAIPFYNSLQDQQQKNNFTIVAINVDEEPEEVRQFLQEHQLNYPVAFDPAGSCPKTYGVQVMPSSYMVDKKGKVRYIQLGYRDGDQQEINDRVRGLLAE